MNPRPPNLLIFMTDQQQADVLTPGHPCVLPNLRRLQADGLTLSQTYAPCAHCCPSRATFFTGLYPSQHGIWNNISTPTALQKDLTPGVRTFGQDLASAGHALAFAGKWHVENARGPRDHGWEELHVTAGPNSRMHPSMESYDRVAGPQGERRPGEIVRPGWGNVRLYGEQSADGSSDLVTVRAAIDALPRLASTGKPWGLYIGTFGPHDPYFVPRRYLDLYADAPLPATYHDTMADKPGIYRRLREQIWGQLSADEVRDCVRHYWAYCTWMDDLLGQVLEALARTGQADDTLVLFVSDHGDYMGAHGLFMKGVAAFREGYQVPCVMRWPNGIARPGRSSDALVSLADFAPTFRELAGLAPTENAAGRSLAPLLHDTPASDWRSYLHSQMSGVELYYTQRAVWDDRHKYVYNGFDYDELYDLRADPGETVNLASRPDYDDVKRALVTEMWRFAKATGDERLFNNYGTVALAPWGPGAR